MSATLRTSTSPRGAFKEICTLQQFHRFGQMKQEDSAELLREILLFWENDNKPLKSLFEGWMTTEVRCKTCKWRSPGWKSLTMLPLHWKQASKSTIEESIKQYLFEESLTPDNKYRCLNCTSNDTAIKRDFTEPPKILLINLTEEEDEKHNPKNTQIYVPASCLDKRIQIPWERLEIKGQKTYKLSGVITHSRKQRILNRWDK